MTVECSFLAKINTKPLQIHVLKHVAIQKVAADRLISIRGLGDISMVVIVVQLSQMRGSCCQGRQSRCRLLLESAVADSICPIAFRAVDSWEVFLRSILKNSPLGDHHAKPHTTQNCLNGITPRHTDNEDNNEPPRRNNHPFRDPACSNSKS